MMPSFFDSCGGKIRDPNSGSIDPVEYERQARAWSKEIIDCRLGPKFTDAYPGQNDTRPTLDEPPKMPVPMHSPAYQDTYQLGSYQPTLPNGQPNDSYGVTAAEALYVPSNDQGPGVDRLYVFSWRQNMISEDPEWDPDHHGMPEEATANPTWVAALGHPVQHPIAASRSPLGQNHSAAILFQDGFIGFAPWASMFFRFPDGVIPTGIALTNNNEFILVTVWDVTNPSQPKGRLAVLMVYWGLPVPGAGTTPHYGSSDQATLTLLGYVDLPFATPTFVAVAANNGAGVGTDTYYAPFIGDLANAQTRADCSQSTTNRYSSCANNVASSGYAVVLSRWENKAAFIDLQPLYGYVQTWLLGSQANYDAATGGAVGGTSVDFPPMAGRWPRTFEVAPEEKPVVAYTVDVQHPLAALAGRGPHNLSPDLDPSARIQAHISTLDGTVRSFDIHHLVNRHTQTPSSAVELASFQAGYNPISMAWAGDVDPLDPTTSTFGNLRGNYSDSYMVLSRARRELQWVYTDGTQSRVFRSLRDSRLEDPVNVDRNNGFHDAYELSVGDFTSSKVVTFRVGALSGDLVRPMQDIPPPSGPDAIECGGELVLTGNVFQVNGANVP